MSKWDRIKVALWEEEVITALTNEPDDRYYIALERKCQPLRLFSAQCYLRGEG
jgi:hypothetical protein